MTIRDIAIAFGYEVDKDSEKKVNESVNKLKSTAGKILGAIGIGFSLSQINALVEQYGAINQRLKSTTGELANQKELQDKIMQSASNTLTSYEATANAVSSYISQSKKVLKTSESALQFTELATKLWKSAGKDEAQIASLHSTLASAFQKNIVDAGTFETILAQSPETIKYLEETLGKSTAQLRAMANAGVLTASHITEAFTKSADKINQAYAEAPMRITDALKVAKEKVALVLTQTDEAMQVTKEISKLIIKGSDILVKGLRKAMDLLQKLTNLLGGTENALRILGMVAVAVFAAKGLSDLKKFTTAFKAFTKLLSPVTLKIALIVAAIVLLLLVIEDIVAFCQGKNSLFGELLKKSGMDVEGTRKQLLDAWEQIKTSLTNAVSSMKEAFGTLTKALRDFWEKHGDKIIKSVTAGIKYVVSVVSVLVKMVANAVDFICALLSGDFEGAFSAVVDFVKNAAELIMLNFGHIIQNIEIWFSGLVKSVSEWWQGIVSKTKEKINSIKQWFADLKSSITKKAEEIKEGIVSFFESIVKWFKKNWVALLLLIINPFAGALALLYKNNDKFKSAVDNLLGKVKSKFGNFKQALKDKVSEWKSGIEQGFANVKAWFEDLPNKALQWGKDMIDNFIQGVKDSIPSFEDVVDGVVGYIKDHLGHSVPSKGPLKDDDKWMPDFMQNLVGGIKKNLPQLKATVGNIVSELAVFANPEPSPVTQNISHGATSTKVINQYNSWTNHFNGSSKQEQADLARSSDTQVTQASNRLGVELAYTR